MAGIVDQFSDRRHRVLISIAQDFPDMLEHIKHAEIQDSASLPASAFAWPEAGLFPIHEPQQTALSKLYAVKQAAAVPDRVMSRIDKALELYGIELPVAEKTAQHNASSDSNFLLPQHRRLVFDKKAHAAPVATALINQSHKLNTSSLATAATNFVKTAAQLGLDERDVPTQIWKYAGMTSCDAGVLLDWVEARACACDSLEKRAMYDHVANHIREIFPKTGVLDDRAELIKIAQAIEEADQEAGIEHLWGRKLLSPLDTVFNMDKVASRNVNLAGHKVSLDALLQLPDETFQEILGEDVLDQASVGGEIDPAQFSALLTTLPMDLQQLLYQHIKPYVR